MDVCINKYAFHTMYYAAIKRNKLLINTMTWLNLETLCLIEEAKVPVLFDPIRMEVQVGKSIGQKTHKCLLWVGVRGKLVLTKRYRVSF